MNFENADNARKHIDHANTKNGTNSGVDSISAFLQNSNTNVWTSFIFGSNGTAFRFYEIGRVTGVCLGLGM
jgi:hypothetical protein